MWVFRRRTSQESRVPLREFEIESARTKSARIISGPH